MADSETGKTGLGARIGAGFIVLVGLPLLIGGAQLSLLHGSPYYLVAGLGLVIAGVQLYRGKASGGLVFAAVLAGTLVWAVWESGVAFWPLLPRVFSPLVVALIALLTMLGVPKSRPRTLAMQLISLGAVVSVLLLGIGLARTSSMGVARTAAA